MSRRLEATDIGADSACVLTTSGQAIRDALERVARSPNGYVDAPGSRTIPRPNGFETLFDNATVEGAFRYSLLQPGVIVKAIDLRIKRPFTMDIQLDHAAGELALTVFLQRSPVMHFSENQSTQPVRWVRPGGSISMSRTGRYTFDGPDSHLKHFGIIIYDGEAELGDFELIPRIVAHLERGWKFMPDGARAVGRAAALAATELATCAMPPALTRPYLRAKSLELLCLIMRGLAAAPASKRGTNVARICDAIAAHPGKPLNIDALAQSVGASTKTLNRWFHAELGVSVGEYARVRRLEHAASLLASTTLPVTEIADVAGFSDHAGFSRAFHHHFGLSPSAYRRQITTPAMPGA